MTLFLCSMEKMLTSLPRVAYARAGLSNRFCPSLSSLLSSVIKKNSLMGDLEAKTIPKQEDKDEIRRILAYVYLVKQKVVLFSAFPRSF